ncbi:MAG: hypothetical protein VX152_12260, partial [Pseudomonadota bacterium]|nr:hypothetical protein [Pseudomonadota bacterium]
FSREQLPRGFVVLLKVVERALLAKGDAALEAALKLLAEGFEACDPRAVPQAGLVQLLDLCECLVLTGGLSSPEPLPTPRTAPCAYAPVLDTAPAPAPGGAAQRTSASPICSTSASTSPTRHAACGKVAPRPSLPLSRPTACS